MSKILKDDWRKIEKLRAKGQTLQSLAVQYGVSKQAIHQGLNHRKAIRDERNKKRIEKNQAKNL